MKERNKKTTRRSKISHKEMFCDNIRQLWRSIKEGCVSAVVRKQGYTPGNITDLNDMTLAVNPFPNDKF